MRPDPPLEQHNGGQQARPSDPWGMRAAAQPPADEPPF
jgi:hypothetical protein